MIVFSICESLIRIYSMYHALNSSCTKLRQSKQNHVINVFGNEPHSRIRMHPSRAVAQHKSTEPWICLDTGVRSHFACIEKFLQCKESQVYRKALVLEQWMCAQIGHLPIEANHLVSDVLLMGVPYDLLNWYFLLASIFLTWNVSYWTLLCVFFWILNCTRHL